MPSTQAMDSSRPAYAVLGATGHCGTALIANLLRKTQPEVVIHAYCRNRTKLQRLVPGIEDAKRVHVFAGSLHDVGLLTECVRGCRAVFLVLSTNDNIPGCRLGQDTAAALVQALGALRGGSASPRQGLPKIVLLSSSTVDDALSRHQPVVLRHILLRAASHVYRDLVETERLLRAQADWLTAIYVKPGALSVDVQRGHVLSLTEQDGPLSYLDLAAGMIEAVDDPLGRYDQTSVSVLNTHGAKARFPTGTPLCLLTGLLRHYFPFLHPYLPLNTGP